MRVKSAAMRRICASILRAQKVRSLRLSMMSVERELMCGVIDSGGELTEEVTVIDVLT